MTYIRKKKNKKKYKTFTKKLTYKTFTKFFDSINEFQDYLERLLVDHKDVFQDIDDDRNYRLSFYPLSTVGYCNNLKGNLIYQKLDLIRHYQESKSESEPFKNFYHNVAFLRRDCILKIREILMVLEARSFTLYRRYQDLGQKYPRKAYLPLETFISTFSKRFKYL